MNSIFTSLGYTSSSTSSTTQSQGSSLLPSNYKNVTPKWRATPVVKVPENTIEKKTLAVKLDMAADSDGNRNRTLRIPFENSFDAVSNIWFNCQMAQSNNSHFYIGSNDGKLNPNFVKELDGTPATIPTIDSDASEYFVSKKFEHGMFAGKPVEVMFTRPSKITLEVNATAYDITSDFATFTQEKPLLLYLLRKFNKNATLVFEFDKTPIKSEIDRELNIVWLQLEMDCMTYDRKTLVNLDNLPTVTHNFADGSVLNYLAIVPVAVATPDEEEIIKEMNS